MHTFPTDSRNPDAIRSWMQQVIDLGRRRLAGSDTELRAQQLMAAQMQKRGYQVHWQPFRTNQSLYSVIGVHAVLGILAIPLAFASLPLAIALQILVVVSIYLDMTKSRHILRRLFPTAPSQNLIALAPNHETAQRHVVLIGHADACYTGWMFVPWITKQAVQRPQHPLLNFLTKGAVLPAAGMVGNIVTMSFVAFAAIAPGYMWTGLWVLFALPCMIAAFLCGHMVWRNAITDGASDNLSGCYASMALTGMRTDLGEDVALSVVITGAEEAGTMGAWHLCAVLSDYGWTRDNTLFVAVDTVTNGAQLHAVIDGEFLPFGLEPDVHRALEQTHASRPDDAVVADLLEIPGGATDAAPLRRRGYNAVGFARTDPVTGASLHYHQLTDNLDNMNAEQLSESMQYLEDFLVAYCHPERKYTC